MTTKTAIDLSYQQRPFTKDLSNIPGEPGLPFLGVTFEMLSDPYKLVDRFYNAYGPVSQSKMASNTFVLCWRK